MFSGCLGLDIFNLNDLQTHIKKDKKYIRNEKSSQNMKTRFLRQVVTETDFVSKHSVRNTRTAHTSISKNNSVANTTISLSLESVTRRCKYETIFNIARVFRFSVCNLNAIISWRWVRTLHTAYFCQVELRKVKQVGK